MSQQPVPGTCSAVRNEGAGSSVVPYLALHPMGFSVPRRLRFERWSLTPPFHPYLSNISNPRFEISKGGIFSVALSIETPRGVILRVYLNQTSLSYAASRPVGVRTFLLRRIAPTKAILRPSKTADRIGVKRSGDKLSIKLFRSRSCS